MSEMLVRDPILQVRDLNVSVGRRLMQQRIVRGISFDIGRGSVTATAGESGSGKTLTALAILRLLPGDDLYIERGRVEFGGLDLTQESEESLCTIRGRRIAMVFQNASSSLNPCLPAREHIAEPLRLHRGLSAHSARAEASRLMREVGIRDAEARTAHYPHQFSGGEQQRLMIAAALACAPELLIADEPTSALDAITQRQVIELLLRMQKAHGFSMLYITHDLALVAGTAERVIVMHNGEIREQGTREKVLDAPSDAYTRRLTAARRRVTDSTHAVPVAPDADPTVVAAAQGLGKVYVVREGVFRRKAAEALKPMSLELHRGETLGVVGESGSGKSTLALCLTRLTAPSSGTVSWLGRDVMSTSGRALRALRRHVQVVFQDPYTTLNPRWTVRQSMLEPLRAHGLGGSDAERAGMAAAMLERVGLAADALERRPHQFSGGQRQRIAIARCLVLDPQVLVCDECVSSLDATVQLQILDLLGDLQRARQLAYLFISHDLAVVRYFTDRVIVLRQGEIVESGPTAVVCAAPRHEYTRALLQAVFTAPGVPEAA